MSEVPAAVGDPVLFSPFPLTGKSSRMQVSLDRVDVSGDGVAKDIAEVILAGYYEPTPGGLIGTARGTVPLDLAEKRLLPPGTVVTVPASADLAFVVAVQGRKRGVWRADYVDLHYTVDGEKQVQRLKYALGVCVVVDLGDPCDAGLPEWWDK